MESIQISVSGNLTSVISAAPVVAGTVGLTVQFSFDPTWCALKKTAVFRVGSKILDVCNAGDIVTVPWELLQKPGCRLWAGVYGVDAEGSLQIPTVWADLGVIQPGADPSGDESADPALPVWEQVCRDTVQCVPQALTPEQQAQARQNIGAAAGEGSGGSVVIVTADFNNGEASMTSEQIYSHVMNGDTVYLEYNEIYLPIYFCNEDGTCFSLMDDKKHIIFGIDSDATARILGYEAVSVEDMEQTIGDIENALDSIIAIQESLIGGADE